MSAYDTVIGLEVHIQMNTKSKAFCGDANSFGDDPNTNVSAISLAHPGTLPVANKAHVNKAVQLGLALGCKINQHNFFDRKHYFYPDLPKGYQITQDNEPVCIGGGLEIEVGGEKKMVEIHHIHMEEDAGKNVHDLHPGHSLLDVNRAGTPLLELVTEPCLSSGEQVFEFMAALQKLLRYIDVSDADMEKGSMRCDCNVSVKLKGVDKLGERCEIKNLNSKRYARDAVTYEAKRQIAILEGGGAIEMGTLHYDVEANVTQVMRTKEGVADYRYLPDPDLPPIHITDDELSQISSAMPAMPWEEKERLNALGLKKDHIEQLIQSVSLVELYDTLYTNVGDAKLASNFLINQYLPAYGTANNEVAADRLSQYLQLIKDGDVSASMAAQRLWPKVVSEVGSVPKDLAEQLGILVDKEGGGLDELIQGIIDANPGQYQQYKSGKKALFGFFMGAVMKSSGGSADPKTLKSKLTEILSK